MLHFGSKRSNLTASEPIECFGSKRFINGQLEWNEYSCASVIKEQSMKSVETDRPYEPLIGSEEAARFLGYSALTVRRMARDGRLPSIPFPRGNGKFQHRFRLSALQAYVEGLSQSYNRPTCQGTDFDAQKRNDNQIA
jgi:excisionase family DNA binding protein